MPEALSPAAPSPARRFDVLFCDVDGCLMPEGQEPADAATLTRIAEYNARALVDRDRPIIVPCTGRPQPYAEAICRLLGGSGDVPAICEHGVWLYDFAAHRWERDPEITDLDLNAVRELEAWIEHELGKHGCYLQLGKSAAVTIFHDRVDWLEHTVVPMLHTVINEHNWPFRVSMTWTCINVDLRQVSKASAIERVIARCSLDRERLAGIGDTIGDLAIRDRVAWFGCPANAEDEIKQHADVVSEQPIARGVLDLLEQLTG